MTSKSVTLMLSNRVVPLPGVRWPKLV